MPDLPRGLQPRTSAPGWHLLLAGPSHHWSEEELAAALRGRDGLVSVHRMGTASPWPGLAHGLVRPDGYIGYVDRGTQLAGLNAYLDRWLPR
ncbi:hypothetical protein ABZ322_06080 [Streptomyces sp. NPDC006129]|uniref:aromatic-ring hydroxylase C-terminal domain-containing protein n=1 Tax=Streptomyces sp. NPDC006129 TaxID=3155348 RepID=UPI0033AB4CE2